MNKTKPPLSCHSEACEGPTWVENTWDILPYKSVFTSSGFQKYSGMKTESEALCMRTRTDKPNRSERH